MLVLAARRGLWIFEQRTEGFSIDHFTFKTWQELSHLDLLHEISLVIDKRARDALMQREIFCVAICCASIKINAESNKFLMLFDLLNT